MKRTFILIFLALAILPIAGQDIILLRDAEEIDCRVVTISDEAVTYRLKGQSHNRVIERSRIFMIKFQNGDKEVFTEGTTQDNATTDASIVKTDKPRASRPYQILDLYDENGVKGIVVEVYDNGYHGTIMSLREKRVPYFQFYRNFDSVPLGLFDENDGYANHKKLLELLYSGKLPLSIDDFPAVKWCLSLGDDWYIPANAEFRRIFYHLAVELGISFDELNKIIKGYNGRKLQDDSDYYATSTEAKHSNGYVYIYSYLLMRYFEEFNPDAYLLRARNLYFLIRPFYRF